MVAHNLPAQPTPFIGRREELDQIAALLADPACRLLTLVGAGGIGKTRLALEAATAQFQCFSDGIYFVPLQPLMSSDFIISTIAEAVQFQFLTIDEPKQQLLRYLHDQALLLIMDNFEHLLDGAPILSEILAAAPGVKLLATSRERLHLREEWVFDVRGLSYPEQDTGDSPDDYGAIQLFIQSARRAGYTPSNVDTASIIHICQLVEGMPLALELAAAWVRAMSCTEIANEIRGGLDILETPARNVPPRHRNMRAVLEHSWGLLSELQRDVFKRLSVFRGGFTRDAAQAVANASARTLSALVDKSWLRWDASRKRYDLHELLRQYADEQLRQTPEDWQQANDRHCHYYVEFLERHTPHLKGAGEKEALEAIEIELENVRTYWEWAVSHQKEAEIGAALESLWLFYDTGSRFQEGEQAFARAAAVLRPNAANPTTRLLLAKVLARQGALCYNLGLFEQSETLLRESRTILHEFDASGDLAFCLRGLGTTLLLEGSNAESQKLFQTSLTLYREIGDLWGIGNALIWLEFVSRLEGNLQQALELAQQSLAVFTQVGNQRGLAEANVHLCSLFLKMSEYREA